MSGLMKIAVRSAFWLVLFWSGVFVSADVLSRSPAVPEFGKRERFLNLGVVDVVSRFHFTPKELSSSLSRQWFEAYFRYLDPQKQFFLEGDIHGLRSFETVLCERQNVLLRLDFLKRVYLVFLQRVQQYALYSTQCLERPMDFTVEETVNFDRKDVPWCKTEEELQELWRKQVKNALLIERLSEEEEAEKERIRREKGESPSKSEGVFRRPPVRERLQRLYAQAYEIRLDASSLEILEGFLTSFTHLFDPHTSYMAPESKEDFDISMSLSLQGIGATLTMKDSYCEIVSLVVGGPAEKSGMLKEGDRIVEVCADGGEPVNVIGMQLSKIVKRIRGPKGTAVHLMILDSDTGETKRVRIVRDEVKLQDAEASSEMREIPLTGGRNVRVQVIYLPSFYADFEARKNGDPNYKNSSGDVRRLLEEGKKEGVPDGVVLDLRGNGGGSLEDAIAIAGLFFKRGPVVLTKNSAGKVRHLSDRDEQSVYDGPLFVMVDMNSASASEIVAAALQDMGRALVIGTRSTHGKGTVQSSLSLERVFNWKKADEPLGALKLTVEKYYRITGASTQLRGVRADIVLPSYQESLEMGEAKLPHPMAWDEIGGALHPKFPGFREDIPVLQAFADEDFKTREACMEYLRDIQEFDELQKQKDIPLHEGKRKAYRKHRESVLKKIRQLTTQRKKARERVRKKRTAEEIEDEKHAQDVIMDETLRLMAQYLQPRLPLLKKD